MKVCPHPSRLEHLEAVKILGLWKTRQIVKVLIKASHRDLLDTATIHDQTEKHKSLRSCGNEEGGD